MNEPAPSLPYEARRRWRRSKWEVPVAVVLWLVIAALVGWGGYAMFQPGPMGQ